MKVFSFLMYSCTYSSLLACDCCLVSGVNHRPFSCFDVELFCRKTTKSEAKRVMVHLLSSFNVSSVRRHRSIFWKMSETLYVAPTNFTIKAQRLRPRVGFNVFARVFVFKSRLPLDFQCSCVYTSSLTDS